MKSKLVLSNFACHLLSRRFFFGLFFDPEDRGDMFIRKVG
jgi:hypothetical protein